MRKLIRWLEKLFPCAHPPKSVTADILEGDIREFQVEWCRICGAYRFAPQGGGGTPLEWRVPGSPAASW
jgi:hypothetical protein